MALNISFISNKLINALKCMFAVIEIILWGNNVLREGHNSSSLFLKKKKKIVFLVTSYFGRAGG